MANQKYLYGQLNQGTSSPANYGGVTSDTAKVTVDNLNRTIRADVLWNAFTGETSDKAYPGDKGARNYQKIIELQSQLNDETLNFIGYKDSIEIQLSKISNDLNKLTVEAKESIQSEINRSKQIDDDLYNRLKEEINRAKKAERDLLNQLAAATTEWKTSVEMIQHQIDLLEGVSGEVVENIAKDLESEITRSVTKDEELSSAIRKEEDRAIASENSIKSTVKDFYQAQQQSNIEIIQSLEDEISKRETAISSVSGRIDTEIERSLKADADISELIRTQNRLISSQRQQVDNMYLQVSDQQSRIEKLEEQTVVSDSAFSDQQNMINEHASKISENEENIHQIQTEVSKNTSSIDILSKLVNRNKELFDNSLSSITNELRSVDNQSKKQIEQIQLLNREIDLRFAENETAHKNLDKKIQDEINRSINKDNDLSDSIVSLQIRSNERLTSLSNNLDKLKQDNDADHSTIHTLLNKQKWMCEQVEQDLHHRIVDLGEIVASMQEKVDQIGLEGVVPLKPQVSDNIYLYGQEKTEVVMVPVDSKPVPSSVVKRDENGNILITSNTGPANSAVSKQYVDTKVDEIIEELDEVFESMIDVEFIDGGTAPINRK